MNAERNNNNNNNNNTDGKGKLIRGRPTYSAVASGSASSPKLLHIEQNLDRTTDSFDLGEISMDEDQDEEEILQKQIDQELNDVDMGEVQQMDSTAVENTTDSALTSNIQSKISMLERKAELLNEKLYEATSRDEVRLIEDKLQIINAQINDAYLQHNALQRAGASAKVSSVGESQGSTSTKLTKNCIPVNLIPVFRITNIDITLVYNNKDGESKKNDNGSTYPNLEAFFTTFESIFRLYKADEPLEHNWLSTLRMSFTPCPELVYNWYKKNIENAKEKLTWTQVKQLITDRFDIPTTKFQRLLRLLRLEPRFEENFTDYVDRFTNLLDRIEEFIPDSKVVIGIFFNNLPKQFRKVLFEKISVLTDHKSDKEDPFPMTWKETIKLFNQHKVVLNNELKKVYESFGSRDSFAAGMKRDTKAKPSSSNEVSRKGHKSSTTQSDNFNHNRKRRQTDDENNHHRQTKFFRHSANGSNASRWAPQNLCRFCRKEPYSKAHRNTCEALSNQHPNNRNNSFNQSNHNTYDKNGSNHGNHTPSFGKQNREFKRVNMVTKPVKINQQDEDTNIPDARNIHPVKAPTDEDAEEFQAELRRLMNIEHDN